MSEPCLAYHFCERIAKQVSPWEYIITDADVAEARAAWLELDERAALRDSPLPAEPTYCVHCGENEYGKADDACWWCYMIAKQTGEEAIEEVNRLRTAGIPSPSPACPICTAHGMTPGTVRLNERFAGAGLYLAKWWCANGHEWSVRSMPWGNEQRAMLRQIRAAQKAEDA